MRFAFSLILLASLSLSTGCATVIRGTHQTVTFVTEPSGAKVHIDGKNYTTPASIDLRRLNKYPVIVAKDGYRTIQFDFDPQWDGVSLVGNLILPGGSIGLVIDTANGADHNFNELADISMVAMTQPSDPPLVLHDFKGHLLTDTELAVAIRADRLDRTQFFRGEP